MRLLLLLIGSWTALSAAECTVRVLEPGASVDGAMAAGDCTAQDILPTASTVSVTALRPLLTQAYSLTVGEGGGVLTLSVASSSFPPAVALVNARNEILALQGGTVAAAAAVQLSVSAGVYQVLAVSQTTATGNYTLKNTLEARRDCAPPDWKFGETLSGELTVSDCRILDLLTPSTAQRPVDVYKVTVAENTVAFFEMAANAFRPVLAVMAVKTGKLVNDGAQSNNGLGAEIYIGLPAGEYYLLVSASTVSGGAYALRSASEPARTCVEEALELPGSVRSALANSDCRLVDYIPFSGNFSFIRAYKIEVPRKGVVTLEQNSTQVDSYLNLLRPDKSVIAEDDEGGGNGNARIAVTLNPGTYTVLANSYDEGEIGAFELKSSFAIHASVR